ncbi:MAG: sortase system peptidoglycan-associated protein [Pseudohongiellaceae bacterium]|jgi:sortase system peptidoglycan-associated protein
MLKLISSLIVCAAVATHSYGATEKANYSGNASTAEETTAVISGLVLGALAGGPPGAIVGGALGALFGDNWHAKQELSGVQLSLAQSRSELAQVKQESAKISALYVAAQRQLGTVKGAKLGVMDVAYSASPLSLCCGNTAISLHFRTGSNLVESHYQDQLAGFGKLVKAVPGTRVEIIGYADRNGDATANLKLSKQRTDAVRVFFNTLGISNADITTIAYGETKPVDAVQSSEADFFDRKVIVRLRDSNDQAVTSLNDDR